ncbi:tRNA glutamyl-Q(34) synthetase GluQRS [Nesterenkonia flava]|uniref:tRNA glutamyl-Q(34) synthetase GluQRS n=1 Tax=Nesterenkonia flava TaxID=469799 RepID=A0ABU1FV41_9MICC|nr:tRNA glutamyl-Q(34) synthetase GluQRS [Nesterenkonia flava]MDR5712528.1 tRNA glutamyl-Q(34) synthetase GluQRS [Nesterenkonia flava]
MSAGRYAPSPSGDLHLGNLRTALLAWLFAASTDRPLLLRYEDLDAGRTVPGSADRQRRDLEALGITFSGEVLHQSQRKEIYDDAVTHLSVQGLVYECFCTRREIQEADRAPHAPPGAYPGTCRNLSEDERARRRHQRPPALRLRVSEDAAGAHELSVRDQLLGQITGTVDDLVLVRNDGAAAYNLAVVVDDHLTGVDQAVRGDDLASSAPRQAYLRGLLYGPEAQQEVSYAHVPLVLNAEGKRLAKRDGAVTLEQLNSQGVTAEAVRDRLLLSLGLPPGPLDEVVKDFDPQALPSEPWIFDAGETSDAGGAYTDPS